MTAEQYQLLAANIPHEPGIYKYFDASNKLIYVGKAKDLRKRTASYFSKTFTGYKTHELVQRIAKIEFTIVESEQDAFLLENALIKQYKPRYNIELKDDKTYPFIVIKKEPFPRVFLTRRKINDGSQYLGPFTSSGKVWDLLNFIRQYIPIRTCKLNLTDSNIKKGKFKVCLEYHLGNCKGPCTGLQDEKSYNEGIAQMRDLLKGNLNSVITSYKKEMFAYVSDLAFEKAEMMKKKIEHLENYQAKSIIVSKHLHNLDVFSLLKEGDDAYINYLAVQNGTIVNTHTIKLSTKLEETQEEVLTFGICNIREMFGSNSLEIIVPFAVELPDTTLVITVPKAGDKKKLLELSEKNVNHYKEELRRKKALHLQEALENSQATVLAELQGYLRLTNQPAYIECFDNSNFQGSYPVSAMVCFMDGLPSKKDYRLYKVKTVEGINDFATMKEVVGRRYKRLLKEGSPFPDLVIIDGGKGQLGSAVEALEELGLLGKMTLVGLAKNEEEIFFPNYTQSLRIPMDSDSLKLIRRIRDEVHRFGITFHRKLRSKGTLKNELEGIEGIGKQTAKALLTHFVSVKRIKGKTVEELSEVVGNAKAKLIWDYFNNG